MLRGNYSSVSEVAREKGVSKAAVYKAITVGRLRARRVGGYLLVSERDAARWTPQQAVQRRARAAQAAAPDATHPEAAPAERKAPARS